MHNVYRIADFAYDDLLGAWPAPKAQPCECLFPKDHARELLTGMRAEELSQYQGLLAVGGDGLFQEVVRGLMAQRSSGGEHALAAARMRVGHIPAGSTDAVAYSCETCRQASITPDPATPTTTNTNTTNNANTTTTNSHNHHHHNNTTTTTSHNHHHHNNTTITTNYNTTITTNYNATITNNTTTITNANANTITTNYNNYHHNNSSGGGSDPAAVHPSRLHHSSSLARTDAEGSPTGVVPNGHMADGRMYLVMVSDCTHLQYLRFLLQLTNRGLHDRCFPYVRVSLLPDFKRCPASRSAVLYDTALALIAVGHSHGWPHLIHQADAMLQQLGNQSV
ncbi:MAG: hypothetical protein WDW36_002790 [Sanguina aurantia]